jgi:hypothetical protein
VKSIHAFSVLLPGHGTGVAIDPERCHVSSPLKANCTRSLNPGGRKTSALSSLLAVALFQRRFTSRRQRD